jgi:hypothetical protein
MYVYTDRKNIKRLIINKKSPTIELGGKIKYNKNTSYSNVEVFYYGV